MHWWRWSNRVLPNKFHMMVNGDFCFVGVSEAQLRHAAALFVYYGG